MEKTKFNPEEHFENIKGKKYLPVAWRLVWFREDHPDWSIETEIKDYPEEKRAVSKAWVKNETGRVIATAHKTAKPRGIIADYLELAETGSIGRALAYCGYGTQFAPELEEDNVVDSPTSPQNEPESKEGKITQESAKNITGQGLDTKAKHTTALSKTYFAVAKNAGYDSEKAKEIAKKAYGVESFTQLTNPQLTKLVERLSTRADKKKKEEEKSLVDELEAAIPGEGY